MLIKTLPLLISAAALHALEFRPVAGPAALAEPSSFVITAERPATPQLELGGHEHPATLYAWMDAAGLQFEINVADGQFDPLDDRKWLWKGDCLYLELDGWADNLHAYGPDRNDVDLLFALTASGPYGKVNTHGDPSLVGDLPQSLCDISFDGTRFRYRITVPWMYLDSAPGQRDAVGMAITIAHKAEEADKEKNDLTWGERGNARDKTRNPKLVQLHGDGKDLRAIILPETVRLLLPDSHISIPVSYAGDEKAVLVLGTGGCSRTIVSGRNILGHLILERADIQDGADTLEVLLQAASGTVLARAQAGIETLDKLYRELVNLIDISDASDPVAALHLQSLKVLALDVVNRSRQLHLSGYDAGFAEAWAVKQFNWLEKSLELLPERGFDLQRHLELGMPLYLAFVSEQDGSLQFATLQVPAGYNPEKAYPFVLYLHGAGPRVPVDFLITAVDNAFHDTLWNSSPEAAGTPQRDVLLLAPFGRGTQGYRDMAEEDVWQAMRITESLFNTDPARRYLTGFSMGCSGAFRLAAHKPDLWAAINLAAGFHSSSETHLVENIQNLLEMPVYVWCGADDARMLDGLNEVVLPLWRQHGLEPRKVVIKADTPHTYPYFEYARMLEMMMLETLPAATGSPD